MAIANGITYSITADGTTSSFDHSGGELAVARTDDATITGGLTWIQWRPTGSTVWQKINGGSLPFVKKLDLPAGEVSVVTTDYAGTGNIVITMQIV